MSSTTKAVIDLDLLKCFFPSGKDMLVVEIGALKLTFALSDSDRLALIELLAGGRRNISVDMHTLFCPMLPTPDAHTLIDAELLGVRKVKA